MSHVENTVQGLMAKVQEFASIWAVVDGPFDDGGAMQRANESKAQLEALIVDALHTSATSLKALHALILDGDLTEAARMCDQLLAQQEQMVAVEPWKDHRTAALVNDLRDCAKTYGNTQQLRERIATIVAPLCAQLKTAELAAAQQAVQATVPKWIDDPHDIEQGQMLNPEWVKLQQSAAPAHPAEGAPAQAAVPVVRGEVLVTVSGFTGSGKSAIAGEIEIMCRALGLQVEWPDGVTEKNMTHADWTTALELYNPRVRIIERNVPRNTASGADQ